MKRSALVLIAAMTLGGLYACGDADKVKELAHKNSELSKENDSLKANVKSLEGSLATITQERDDLKTAAERAAADKASADKGSAKPTAKVAAKKSKKHR